MSKRKLECNDLDDLWKKFKEFENEIARARAQRTRHRQHRGDSRLEVSPQLPSRSRAPSPEPESPSSSRSSSVTSSSSSCSRSSRSQRGRETPSTRSRSAGLPPPHTPSQEPSRYEDVPSNEGVHNQEDSVTGNAGPPPAPPGSEPQQPLVAELDDELLQVLGEDPLRSNTPGKDIQSDLAVRLQHIATSGLSKETRKELLSKYLLPGNCTLINAPDLNAEVKAAISDTVYKRDQGIKTRQKQTAAATSCIAEALTVLLSAETRDMTLIKLLMDANKLLCDTQYQDSVTRRNFILHNLKKDLKEQLQATKVDKYLFSQGLADTLKAAKAISKSGADLKQSYSTPQTQKKTIKGKNNLNWRAPLPNHKQKGASRRKEPARSTRPENYYRQSSRPAPPPPPPPPAAPRAPPRAHR